MDAILSVAFSPDGRHVLTASWDKTARIWDVSTGRQIRALMHEGSVVAAAFGASERFVLTETPGGSDSPDDSIVVHLWDAASGKELHSAGWRGTISIGDFTCSPDGRIVLAGDPDSGKAQLLDPATGHIVR